MKKMSLAAVCMVLMFTSISCGTVKGVGEDLTAVGGWVTKGSDNVKEGR